MIKKCRFCGREFNSGYRAALYCSPVCAGAARTRVAKERNAAYAAKIGLTPEQLEREIKYGHISKRAIAAGAPHRKAPKTYREIQYENRQRRVVGGWRGQPVLGGGHTFRCEAPIRASELPRMTTGFKCVDLRRKRMRIV